jgi:CRISPR-associated protein Cmr1
MEIEMQLAIETLTPLWTGGVETGKVDRIHESGILGSLRWWYEAIVRGLGGKACDPSKGECRFDTGKYEKRTASDERQRQRLRDAGLCDVCQLFGATGWRRRFRLEVTNDQTAPLWTGNQPLNIRPPGRNRGWFLPPGRMGTFTLRIHGDAASVARLLALLRFVERWGSLGAKPQLGYGVIAIPNWDAVKNNVNDFSWRQAAQSFGANLSSPNPDLPDLRHFGFFRYRFQTPDAAWWSHIGGIERVAAQVRPFAARTVPVTPALKNVWRFQHWQRAWGDERTFWGRVATDRIRGKVAVSWAYPRTGGWEIRGSAWLSGVQPKPVWQLLSNAAIVNQTLGVTGTMDTMRPQTTDELLNFLENL